MPEQYGGAGLGITEAAIVLQEIAAAGAGLTRTNAIHMNIFGANPIVKHGTPDQKARYLPEIVAGRLKIAFGVTEPNAGLETTRITTRARRTATGWEITGHKIWISTAQEADRILLLTRTTPYDDMGGKTDGLTFFLLPL